MASDECTANRFATLFALRDRVAAAAQRRGTLAAGAVARPGAHLAQPLGAGMDFAGLRIYQPGDDVRHVDWRHTARRGRPYTKLFRAERDLGWHFLIDQSPGMHFATRGVFKSVQAERVAIALAWQAVLRGDRVGGGVLGDARPPLAARGWEAGIAALIDRVLDHPGGLGSPLLQAVATGSVWRSRWVIVSDFSWADDAFARDFARIARRHAVTLIRIFDPIERDPPPPGVYRVDDGRKSIEIDLRSADARRDWGEQFRQQGERLHALARSPGVDFVEVATDADPLAVIAQGQFSGDAGNPARGGEAR